MNLKDNSWIVVVVIFSLLIGFLIMWANLEESVDLSDFQNYNVTYTDEYIWDKDGKKHDRRSSDNCNYILQYSEDVEMCRYWTYHTLCSKHDADCRINRLKYCCTNFTISDNQIHCHTIHTGEFCPGINRYNSTFGVTADFAYRLVENASNSISNVI